MKKIKFIKETADGSRKVGDIISFDDKFADGIVNEGYAEYIIDDKIELIGYTEENPEWNKFIGDLRHSVKLAAKQVGKSEKEAKDINWDFFNLRKEERDPEKLCQLAIKYCKDNNLANPHLPSVPIFDKTIEQKNKKVKNKDHKQDFEYAAGGETDSAIYEIIYEPKIKQTKFVKFSKNPGTVEIVEEYRDDLGNLIKPYAAAEYEELLKNGVILPDGIEDYSSVEDLQREIQAFIHRWVDVDERFEKFASYYIMLTWVYEKANSLVYLRLKGPHGMGKSRFLKAVGQICFRAMPGGGAVGAAPIFRKIDRWHGTLLMDEADFKNSDESVDIIKIINCGFEKGTPVERCDQNDATKLRFFDVFGPKILCTRKEWSDSATESRCLTHNVYMTTRKDIKDSINLEFYTDQAQLRRKLLMFRFRKIQTIDFDKALEIDLGPIEPRLRQTNRAFAALFLDNDALQAEFKQFLLEYAKELSEQMSESLEGLIINSIISLSTPSEDMQNPQDFVPMSVSANDIYQHMQNEGMLSQKSKTSTRSIGKILRSLGFKSLVRKVDGKAKRCLVLEKSHLESILPRYIADPQKLQSYVCYMSIEERGGHVTFEPGPGQTTLNQDNSEKIEAPSNNVTNVTCNSTVDGIRLHDKKASVTCNHIPDATEEYASPETINMPCSLCGASLSHFWDKRGKPICGQCRSDLGIIPTD